jgi:hypothetical protein
MATFPNAAPPPGALFDNAPTVPLPAVTMLTRAGYRIPATLIGQQRGGKWVAVDVWMQYGAPVPLDLALKRVAIGRTVFVRREDAGTVMEAVRGVGSGDNANG